jgi:hypothetical protein
MNFVFGTAKMAKLTCRETAIGDEGIAQPKECTKVTAPIAAETLVVITMEGGDDRHAKDVAVWQERPPERRVVAMEKVELGSRKGAKCV